MRGLRGASARRKRSAARPLPSTTHPGARRSPAPEAARRGRDRRGRARRDPGRATPSPRPSRRGHAWSRAALGPRGPRSASTDHARPGLGPCRTAGRARPAGGDPLRRPRPAPRTASGSQAAPRPAGRARLRRPRPACASCVRPSQAVFGGGGARPGAGPSRIAGGVPPGAGPSRNAGRARPQASFIRRAASSTAAWTLRLATASPTRQRVKRPSGLRATAWGRPASSAAWSTSPRLEESGLSAK